MKPNEKQIWFPAKKYGWGWGPPCAWQGWVVIAGFAVLLSTAAALFLPGGHFALWIASVLILAAGMIIMGYVKGEKPRWRWGKD